MTWRDYVVGITNPTAEPKTLTVRAISARDAIYRANHDPRCPPGYAATNAELSK